MNATAMASRLGTRTFVTLRGHCPCCSFSSDVLLATSAGRDWNIGVSFAPRRSHTNVQEGRRFFTSPPDASRDDKECENEAVEDTTEKHESPRPPSIPFPWRHSSEPLDRVAAKDDRSGLQNNAKSRFVRRMLVAHELGIPWWSRLTGSWEAELADNFVWSFRAGLSGLLSSKFGVPLDEINDEGGGPVSIDTTSEVTETSGEEDKEIADELVKAALEEELRILYGSIDPTSVKIKLKVQPVAWQLDNAFLIPLLTRDQVKNNPALRGSYQAIEREFAKSGSVEKVREMGEQLAKDSGFAGMRTIIAEVSIQCLESFQVWDRRTGDVIQGNKSDEEEEVTHVVRFEVVTSNDGSGGRVAGSWQIIDWDDLLQGNVWH